MQYPWAKGRLVISLWTLFLVSFFFIATFHAVEKMHHDKLHSSRLQHERLDPNATEEDKTQVDLSQLPPPNGATRKVEAGIYVDRIIKISTKGTDWTVDFYLWFNWSGDGFDPGEEIQVINGEIVSKARVKSASTHGRHYALYRITAHITKFFDIVRYPLDNHVLTIRIEDKTHSWNSLQYVADARGSAHSSRVEVPGYRITGGKLLSKPHAYQTRRGDPRLPEGRQGIYSQLVYGIAIQRPDMGLYFKMFQGLFASVAIAFLAFIFNPLSDNRIDLGVGAFFASVASSYLNLSELPGVGLVTLTDMVNGLGMVTIFLTLMASVISASIAKRPERIPIAIRFDRFSLFLFIAGFVVFNIAIVLAATVAPHQM